MEQQEVFFECENCGNLITDTWLTATGNNGDESWTVYAGHCDVCDEDYEHRLMDAEYDEDDYEPECPHCHGLGGNIYDDRVTPCPVCKK